MYRFTLLVAAFIHPLGVELPAQGTAELRARAERLQERRLALVDDELAAGRLRHPPSDTLQAGSVMALFPRIYWRLAHASLPKLTESAPAYLKSSLSHTASITLFVLYHAGHPVSIDTSSAHAAGRIHIRLIDVDSTSTPEDVLEKARRHLANLMRHDLDTVAANWLRNWMPTTPPSSIDRERVYTNLATELSAVSRKCAMGDLAACALALRVTPVENAVRDLYDNNDRRLFVSRLASSSEQTRLMEAERISLCLGGNDPACVEALGRVAPDLLPAPTDQTALSIFFHDVLRSGGEGAMERFGIPGQLTVRQRLEHAGGKPLEQLLGEWHRSIKIGGSPWPTRLERWTTLSLSVVMLGLALVRRDWI